MYLIIFPLLIILLFYAYIYYVYKQDLSDNFVPCHPNAMTDMQNNHEKISSIT